MCSNLINIKNMKLLKNLFVAAVALITVTSCATKEEKGWTVNATINGIESDSVVVYASNDIKNPTKLLLANGKFTAKGKVTSVEPISITIHLKKTNVRFGFYVESGVTTYLGDISFRETQGRDGKINKYAMVTKKSLEGSIVNKHQEETNKFIQEQRQKAYNLSRNLTGEKVSQEERATISQNAFNEANKKIEEYRLNFIKNNPNAYYSGIIICDMAPSLNAADIKELIAILNPNLKNSKLDKLKKKLEESKDVKISEAISASNVSYKVDASYDGSSYKEAKYLGSLSNGNLVALNNDKTITIIDANGKKVKSFVASKTSVPSTMGIDEKDNIFVLIPEEKEEEQNYRGKKRMVKKIVSYDCVILDTNGKTVKSYKLDGIKHATGARVANNKLMIADMGGRNIGIYNAETGVNETKIENMRPCCGILDFSINDKNELLVANLGAFRVQSYDLTGKQILAFGSRGTGLNEFHGCCNPVSVAYLSNGAIVTVEKDPTRVKVYSKEGAMAIAGIDEMVKGCSYIPMTTDKKDNLYLASPTKGVVRCVAI